MTKNIQHQQQMLAWKYTHRACHNQFDDLMTWMALTCCFLSQLFSFPDIKRTSNQHCRRAVQWPVLSTKCYSQSNSGCGLRVVHVVQQSCNINHNQSQPGSSRCQGSLHSEVYDCKPCQSHRTSLAPLPHASSRVWCHTAGGSLPTHNTPAQGDLSQRCWHSVSQVCYS